VASSAATAQYYVLRDDAAPLGDENTNPHQSTDETGSPDVVFSFTPRGAQAFQRMTSVIAHRGVLVSRRGTTLNQHFAIALDTTLITVPEVNFKSYPTGIRGDNGADINTGSALQSAREIATELRLGALPIQLRLISTKRLSVSG
jgi:preprotein translocase subunit SecD